MKKIMFLVIAVTFLANTMSAQDYTVKTQDNTVVRAQDNTVIAQDYTVRTQDYTVTRDYPVDMREQMQFGLKGGVNVSNIYDTQDQDFNAEMKVGFVGGLFLSVPIGKFVGLQPEVLYSQKGYKASGSLLTVPYELTHTSTYIDVPLLLQIKPSAFFTLLAGPQYSFLIKQKAVFTTGSFTDVEEENFRNDKSVLCFIGGFDITLSAFVIGGRVGWDMQNNNGDGTSTSPRYKNAWYQATLGLRF